jgi:hypothetical protein
VDEVGAHQSGSSERVSDLVVLAEAVDGRREVSLGASVRPVGEHQAAAGLHDAGDLPDRPGKLGPEIESVDRENLVEDPVRVRKSLHRRLTQLDPSAGHG